MLPLDLPSCFPEGCPITDIVHCSSLGYSRCVRSGDIKLAPPHCMLWQCPVSIITLWWHAPLRSLLFLSVFLWPILRGWGGGAVITANKGPVNYINVLLVNICCLSPYVAFDWVKKQSLFYESRHAINSTVQMYIYQDSAASYQLVGSYFSPFSSPDPDVGRCQVIELHEQQVEMCVWPWITLQKEQLPSISGYNK